MMKLLLTSAGIQNPSIHNALIDLLGKPIADSNALCIPRGDTGVYPAAPLGYGASSAENPPNPCASWVGSRWACWSSPRRPASASNAGSPGYAMPTSYWSTVATHSIWRTGCVSRDRRISCRRCPTRPGLVSALQHGADPADRGRFRRLEAARRRRRSAGDRRLLDLSAMATAEKWAAEIAGPA
jgi:hypothetical protein